MLIDEDGGRIYVSGYGTALNSYDLKGNFANAEGEGVGFDNEIWSYRCSDRHTFHTTFNDTLYHYNPAGNRFDAVFKLDMTPARKSGSYFVYQDLPGLILANIVGGRQPRDAHCRQPILRICRAARLFSDILYNFVVEIKLLLQQMERQIYKSRIDWWCWLVYIFMVGIAVVVAVDSTWWVALPIGGSMIACILLMAGCWYEIDGNQLVVYQFFRPNRFPIDKISEVRKTRGYLATAGMSSRRVSIKFTDRSVLKSSMPLEISPRHRDSFMTRLREINPAIIIG